MPTEMFPGCSVPPRIQFQHAAGTQIKHFGWEDRKGGWETKCFRGAPKLEPKWFGCQTSQQCAFFVLSHINVTQNNQHNCNPGQPPIEFSKLLLSRIVFASSWSICHWAMPTEMFPGCSVPPRIQFQHAALTQLQVDGLSESLLLEDDDASSPELSSLTLRSRLKHLGHLFHFNSCVSSGSDVYECTCFFPAHFHPHLVAQLWVCSSVCFCSCTMDESMLTTYPESFASESFCFERLISSRAQSL